MKWLVIWLMSGVVGAAFLPCGAGAACAPLELRARVEVANSDLTLADLLAEGSCAQFQQAAAQVSLGRTPRAGSVRVLDGAQVRQLLAGLADGVVGPGKTVALKIPERIVVERAGAAKSCGEIARFVAGAAPAPAGNSASNRWQEDLNCAAARAIPENAQLELTRTAWNVAAQRWEFALRCVRPEDCVPFLVWAGGEKLSPLPVSAAAVSLAPQAIASIVERLVKPGQTATLTWDGAGIRIVLPVTCLEAGGAGQFVRVKVKNGARILRAEVLGDGTLRANL
jgi:hypothetical protein